MRANTIRIRPSCSTNSTDFDGNWAYLTKELPRRYFQASPRLPKPIGMGVSGCPRPTWTPKVPYFFPAFFRLFPACLFPPHRNCLAWFSFVSNGLGNFIVIHLCFALVHILPRLKRAIPAANPNTSTLRSSINSTPFTTTYFLSGQNTLSLSIPLPLLFLYCLRCLHLELFPWKKPIFELCVSVCPAPASHQILPRPPLAFTLRPAPSKNFPARLSPIN